MAIKGIKSSVTVTAAVLSDYLEVFKPEEPKAQPHSACYSLYTVGNEWCHSRYNTDQCNERCRAFYGSNKKAQIKDKDNDEPAEVIVDPRGYVAESMVVP